MMQHSALNRGLLFEMLKDREDAGDPQITDDEIMERFNFDAPEQARTLLADLADKGLITVKGTGPDRVVTIRGDGWSAPRPVAAERPLPSVVKPDREVEAMTSRIMNIVQRSPNVVSPAPRAAAAPAPTAPPVVLPDPPRTRFQVNIKVSEAQFNELGVLAEAGGVAVGSVARRFFESGMASAEPIHKPLVRAHVIRAARDAGIPIEEFVTALIECGLQRFLAGLSLDVAA